MADKGHQGYANTDEERQRQNAEEGGHASHEKGAAHEFNNREAADAGRRGNHAHAFAHASRETVGEEGNGGAQREASPNPGGQPTNADQSEESATPQRGRRTRGGTHDQHVTAGKKGGSRIRELIELGYKYEQEHGIGPGQNERSKLAAKRRTSTPGEGEGGE